MATCDQTGYCLAFRAMARMYKHLGRAKDADRWDREADNYTLRASKLLWDGTKFLHHVHIDPIDHGDFDETKQLAMSNTWAMTRGLATEDQSRRIVDEYRRRHKETGDAYPWWSLQPGYPDRLGYFHNNYCKQGGYANGGLMPWVGGELCRGAFLCGREEYAVELLRQYADHLRRTGGAKVWYWPDGTPGFRTTNEVPYSGWGMAEWVHALIQGLAGLEDRDSQMRTMLVAPRWAATPVDDVRTTIRYAASNACFAYHMQIDRQRLQIRLSLTGSGNSASLQILLPKGWTPQETLVDGKPVATGPVTVDASRYVELSAPIHGVTDVLVQCDADK